MTLRPRNDRIKYVESSDQVKTENDHHEEEEKKEVKKAANLDSGDDDDDILNSENTYHAPFEVSELDSQQVLDLLSEVFCRLHRLLKSMRMLIISV